MQAIKTQTKGKKMSAGPLVTDGVGNDILMGAVYAFGACAIGILGAWAFSSLVAGVIHAGGPLAMLGSLINAVTGV